MIRFSPALLCVALLGCASERTSDALTSIEPFDALRGVHLGMSGSEVAATRTAVKRAPMGGLREQLGPWLVHYDLPNPSVDSVMGATRLREIVALRAFPDVPTAERTRDSLLQVVQRASGASSATVRCVQLRMPTDTAILGLVRIGNEEVGVGYWRNASGRDVALSVRLRQSLPERSSEAAVPCSSSMMQSATN